MNRFYLLDIVRSGAVISVAIFNYKLFYACNLSLDKLIIEILIKNMLRKKFKE